ncbi:MAG TPA: response regulator [Acidobacteriota bacterium]|nr:response regulator [Acidobacteriota bacterium]
MALILLVDDDQDIIDINRTVLARRGHDIAVAYSAAEAKKVAGERRPDLAVIDVMMEEPTIGFELARSLRELYPEMLMIMLTGIAKEMQLGYTFSPDETWLPVSKFMEKPVNPSVLADLVDTLLKSAH